MDGAYDRAGELEEPPEIMSIGGEEDLGGGREGISSMDIPARAPQPVRVRPEEGR